MNDDNNKPLTFLEVLGSVLAGAFGVQSSAMRERDFTRGNVIHFIVIGILFTASFVLAVVGVVQWILP